jgi:hypothetical protein
MGCGLHSESGLPIGAEIGSKKHIYIIWELL